MEHRSTISVVLTTYNGEQFLEEQIRSLLNQSRKPDEMIIMDDCSSDCTAEIVRAAIGTTDVPCRLHINEQNKGWRQNFTEGFHLASGDIIFCADQDDIWLPTKLEIMTGIMDENPQINVLACNLTPLYENNATRLADFYISNYGEDYLTPVRLSEKGLSVLRPGCTMCFRKSILPWYDSIWTDRLAHDEVLWAVGLATDSLFIVNEPLIQFRRHGQNNSPGNQKRLSVRLNRIECDLTKIQGILHEASLLHLKGNNMDYLERLSDYLDDRRNILLSRNPVLGLRLLKYSAFYSSPKAWAADMISMMKG